MQSKQITKYFIGIINTPLNSIKIKPVLTKATAGIKEFIKMCSKHLEVLIDIENLSKKTLLYLLHKTTNYYLLAKPFMNTKKHEIFASKLPKKQIAIKLSTAKLLEIKKNNTYIKTVAMLNRDLLIDLKLLFLKFNSRKTPKARWLNEQGYIPINKLRSNERF